MSIEDLITEATQVRDATEVGENTATRVGQLFLDIINSMGTSTPESIKGYVVIQSVDDLIENPTLEEQQKGYVLADNSMLYLYVGSGGDTLNGSYQSVELQGAQGQNGVGITSIEKTATAGLVDTYTITMTDGNTFDFEVTNGMNGVDLGLANIVNDLTTGGATNVLSAEQGKILRDNLMLIYDALSEGAFWNGKPTLSWASVDSFQVINNLDGVTNSNIATTIAKNGTYSATLTSSGDFDVTITMGGTDVTSLVYNDSTGAISIAEVTGALVITAVVEVEPQIEIYDGYAIDTDGSMVAASGKSATDFIPISAIKLVWSAGATGTTSNRYNLVLYNENKEYIEYYNANGDYRMLDLTSHAQASSIAFIRITFLTSKINTRICYDITNGRFIFKGEDYDGRLDNFLWGQKNAATGSGVVGPAMTTDLTYCFTDFIELPATCASFIMKNGESTTDAACEFYTASKDPNSYWQNTPDPRTITHEKLTTTWKYVRLSVLLSALDSAYAKDNTNNTYLWKGFNIE